MTKFIPALAAACLSLCAATSFAQMSPSPSGERRSATPEQRQQFKERITAAREACKSATDQRACMTQQFCSKSENPAKCMEFAKKRSEHMQQRAEQRQKMHEACNGKRGDDLAACLKTQKDAFHKVRLEQRQKAHEACNAKRGDDLIKCLREQPGGFGGRGHHGHGGMHGIRS